MGLTPIAVIYCNGDDDVRWIECYRTGTLFSDQPTLVGHRDTVDMPVEYQYFADKTLILTWMQTNTEAHTFYSAHAQTSTAETHLDESNGCLVPWDTQKLMLHHQILPLKKV